MSTVTLRAHAVDVIQRLPGVRECSEGFGATEGINIIAATHDDVRFLDNLLEDRIDGLNVNISSPDRCGTPHRKPLARDVVNILKCLPGVEDAGYTEYRSMPPQGRFSIQADSEESRARLDAILSDNIAGFPAGNPQPGASVTIYVEG